MCLLKIKMAVANHDKYAEKRTFLSFSRFCTGGADKKLRIFYSDLKQEDSVKVRMK